MPTGYTHDIKDGISFKTYALNCARAFGACVELRDEPGGGDRIPESFKPSSYHADRLAETRLEMAALEVMTPADWERGAAKDYDDAETARVMALRERAELRQQYEFMLTKAQQWVPPTDDHRGLREFMIQQIVDSIKFDCDGGYYDTPTTRLTGQEWADKRRASLARDIDYHSRKHDEEVARAAGRTAWVKALRESLII